MNTRQQHINRKALRIPVGLPLVWAVLGVTLVIALAITLATQLALAPKVSKPAVTGQSVPDANTQAVLDYLRAHGYGQPSTVQAAPDANTQAVMDYLRAHGYGRGAPTGQTEPDAIAQSHVLQLFPSQAVPDPNTQAVMDYLRAHGVAAAASIQSTPVPR